MKIVLLWITLTTIIYSQQIINLSDFQPYYSVYDKTISLSGGNPNILKQFLHELGHHIWFYGGVDTTTYKEEYYMFDNIRELFANEHYYYFLGESMTYSKQIFDKFYNRSE